MSNSLENFLLDMDVALLKLYSMVSSKSFYLTCIIFSDMVSYEWRDLTLFLFYFLMLCIKKEHQGMLANQIDEQEGKLNFKEQEQERNM